MNSFGVSTVVSPEKIRFFAFFFNGGSSCYYLLVLPNNSERELEIM